jgi:hypothetical protein
MSSPVTTDAIIWGYAFLLGIAGGARALWNIRMGCESVRWPILRGRVLKSSARNYIGRYRPIVRYEYEQDGKAFQGSRIMYATIFISSKFAAEAFLREFQTGAAVEVRMRPNRPQTSVLRPGNSGQNWVELVSALAFCTLVGSKLYALLMR